MKVSELEGAKLDLWVARADGKDAAISFQPSNPPKDLRCFLLVNGRPVHSEQYQPSVDGRQGVPIIDRERIATSWGDAWQQSEIKDDGRTWHVVEKTPAQWYAYMVLDPVEAMRRLPEGARLTQHEYRVRGTGPTLLIAAMRCFVASRFGEVTPEETT